MQKSKELIDQFVVNKIAISLFGVTQLCSFLGGEDWT